jgi:hypothetical protein
LTKFLTPGLAAIAAQLSPTPFWPFGMEKQFEQNWVPALAFACGAAGV